MNWEEETYRTKPDNDDGDEGNDDDDDYDYDDDDHCAFTKFILFAVDLGS